MCYVKINLSVNKYNSELGTSQNLKPYEQLFFTSWDSSVVSRE